MPAPDQPLFSFALKFPKETRRAQHRLTRMIVLGLLLVFSGIGLAGQLARLALVIHTPAPGQLVDIGGYQLHLYCQGPFASSPGANQAVNSPTLVLEAGLGESSLTWASLMPLLAQHHRVCAYDRAGYGWSDSSLQPLSVRATGHALHTLLHRSGEEGPYVLVGHSLGALYVRAYTHAYPDEVVALVLLDPSHEEMVSRLPATWQEYLHAMTVNAERDMWLPMIMSDLGIFALWPHLYLGDPRLPGTAQTQQQALIGMGSRTLCTIGKEIAASEALLAEVREASLGDLGDLPLLVISAELQENDLPQRLPSFTPAYDLHQELAALSSRGQRMTLPNTSHYIHYDQPQQVAAAIQTHLQIVE